MFIYVLLYIFLFIQSYCFILNNKTKSKAIICLSFVTVNSFVLVPAIIEVFFFLIKQEHRPEVLMETFYSTTFSY